ncbi:MAG: hypothetical protein H6737_14245 [Alphaproteobacteria bacterium]|nr:hypothetical protein [Alphaproteobacteria bacterium]
MEVAILTEELKAQRVALREAMARDDEARRTRLPEDGPLATLARADRVGIAAFRLVRLAALEDALRGVRSLSGSVGAATLGATSAKFDTRRAMRQPGHMTYELHDALVGSSDGARAVVAAGGWEDRVDAAEACADDLGFPLALVRRIPPTRRGPEHPAPAPSVLAERQQFVVHDNQQFVELVGRTDSQVDGYLDQCARIRKALLARWPDAASAEPEVPHPADVLFLGGGDPMAALAKRFEALEAIGATLVEASASEARAGDLLGAMVRWQDEAKAIAEMATRLAIDFVPPVNEGGDLVEFARGLQTALPALRDRLDALLERRSGEG